MHIAMIAAENDALPGGKVGGLGDVIRDLPPALGRSGHDVSVITPGYGILAPPADSQAAGEVEVDFCGHRETLSLFNVRPPNRPPQVNYWVIEHPLFSAGGKGKIYTSTDYAPFASDAHKFALFSIAAAELIRQQRIGALDVLHCHDWHTTLVLILRRYAERYHGLQTLPAVFSIHNLSLQGVRPLRGDRSALEHWLPDLTYAPGPITQPGAGDLVNFMRAGINLADTVHTVSPTYAGEILQASDPSRGFVGGEGLEADLRAVHAAGRLVGILNGCDYSKPVGEPLTQAALFKLIDDSLNRWGEHSSEIPAGYYYALRRVSQWRKKRKTMTPVLVAIGRMVEQKAGLLTESVDAQSAMEEILSRLDSGLFIMLGSGDETYERFFTRLMASHNNFIYLQGYSEPLANALYQFGDLFVMPSTYEPCGISQMLALRAGTPCLVHATGGLKDTVRDGANGFVFDGDSRADKARNLVRTVERALHAFHHEPDTWRRLCRGAAAARFSWDESARQYASHLYTPHSEAVSPRPTEHA